MHGSRFKTRIVFSVTAAALLLLTNVADPRSAHADDSLADRPKIGLVLVVLGVSHFLHIAIYARIHGKPRVPHSPAGNYPVTAEVVESRI